MRLLLDMIKEDRIKGRTAVEEAPKGAKGSNGIVERAVQEIAGHKRAILFSLEERIGVEIDAKERIVASIPSYAAYLYNRPHRDDER
eukprot:8671896-Karenia_brevis.AAC.1